MAAECPGEDRHSGSRVHHVLPTGEQFEIRAGDVHAIVTEVGAGLRALSHGDRHLIETFPEDARPARGMGAVLVPWPNRTAHGRWQWNGGDQQLALTEPDAGNAIHGLLRHVVYQVGERADDAITLVAVDPAAAGLAGRAGHGHPLRRRRGTASRSPTPCATSAPSRCRSASARTPTCARATP